MVSMSSKILMLPISAVMFASATALQCYVCDTADRRRELDYGCEAVSAQAVDGWVDPALTERFLADCDAAMAARKVRLPPGQMWNHCVKMELEERKDHGLETTETRIIRTCGWDRADVNEECYDTKRQGQGVTVSETRFCTCDEADGCNGNNGLYPLPALIVTTTLHTVIKIFID